jgi:pimeloyl-ACP methyl ester carboxylesterase
MIHKFIRSERGTVHYWINRNFNENARCIVFTHGLTANHMMFEKQVDCFSNEYTVITWDIPLHGESRPYNNFSYKNTASDLKDILDTENINQVILVGMSMGGYPSQEFAVQYPERVLAFIALDTTPFGLSYYSHTDEWWLKQVGTLAKLFSNKMLRKSMAKSVSKTKYAYDLMLKMLEPLSKAEIIQQMDIAYGGFLKENKNVKFNFPVLILLGEYDKTGKVRQYCVAWANREGYPLHIIKGAAHFSNADNADDVNREISSFIEENV